MGRRRFETRLWRKGGVEDWRSEDRGKNPAGIRETHDWWRRVKGITEKDIKIIYQE